MSDTPQTQPTDDGVAPQSTPVPADPMPLAGAGGPGGGPVAGGGLDGPNQAPLGTEQPDEP